MNQKERLRLREVLKQLERGPGSGWAETLDGNRGGLGYIPSLAERETNLRLWLNSWIVPPIEDVVERYAPVRKAAR